MPERGRGETEEAQWTNETTPDDIRRDEREGERRAGTVKGGAARRGSSMEHVYIRYVHGLDDRECRERKINNHTTTASHRHLPLAAVGGVIGIVSSRALHDSNAARRRALPRRT
jgi:hypothetical protein